MPNSASKILTRPASADHDDRDQANALVINADENTLRGWLDLQRMWFDNRNDPTLLKAGVKDWQTRYPQNPAPKCCQRRW